MIAQAPTSRAAAKSPARGQKMVSLDGLLTVEQWAKLPELKPAYELLGGKLVQKMVNTTAHGWAVSRFLFQCMLWGQTSKWRFFTAGPGTEIGPRDGFIPDVMGFPPEEPMDTEATYLRPPFVAVEVLSKSTARLDRGYQKDNYGRAGVQVYVLIDTQARTMEVYRLTGAVYGEPEVLRQDGVWQPGELPGLRLEINDLWYQR